jgi:hypothetical protein
MLLPRKADHWIKWSVIRISTKLFLKCFRGRVIHFSIVEKLAKNPPFPPTVSYSKKKRHGKKKKHYNFLFVHILYEKTHVRATKYNKNKILYSSITNSHVRKKGIK